MIEQPPARKATATAGKWAEVEEWDRAYYLHAVQRFGDAAWEAVDSAEGNYVTMSTGQRMLDFVSQASSDHMGHRHPAVVREIELALHRYGHVMYSLGTDYRARAAKLIIEDLLGADDWAGRVRFLVTGSESVESAINMARLFTGRSLILSQQDSFHGHTAGSPSMVKTLQNRLTPTPDSSALSVPGFPAPYIVEIPRPEPQSHDGSQGLPSIAQTAAIIDELGRDQVAAVVTETFSGGGLWMSHPEYLPQLRELTRRHGILWIDDEVVCGFGRLGRWFSYQLYSDVVPDLMVIGKGTTGGILPSGGVVANREISELFEQGSWQSRSTWDGHPLIAAALCANVEAMIEENVIDRAAASGEILGAGLRTLSQRHASVSGVAGAGLAYAVELVGRDGLPVVRQDRGFEWGGDLSTIPSALISRSMAQQGVLISGALPNTVKLTPPLRITSDEIERGLTALDDALTEYDKTL